MILIFSFKKGNKDLKDISPFYFIIITIFLSITNILNISDLTIILFICSLFNLKKDISLKISLLYYSLINIFIIILTPIQAVEEYFILSYVIGTIIAGIFTIYSINCINDLIKKNKLWKLALYFFFLSLFLMYWFR